MHAAYPTVQLSHVRVLPNDGNDILVNNKYLRNMLYVSYIFIIYRIYIVIYE